MPQTSPSLRWALKTNSIWRWLKRTTCRRRRRLGAVFGKLATVLASTALALLLLVGALGGGGPNLAGASSRCGSLSISFEGGDTHRYAVRVTRGTVTCRRARRVMRRFI